MKQRDRHQDVHLAQRIRGRRLPGMLKELVRLGVLPVEVQEVLLAALAEYTPPEGQP